MIDIPEALPHALSACCMELCLDALMLRQLKFPVHMVSWGAMLGLVLSGCTEPAETPSPSPSSSPSSSPEPTSPTPEQVTPTPAHPTPTPEPVTATPANPTPTPEPDEDDDGYSPSEGDCDDTTSSSSPAATDIPYDGIDQDCSGSDLIDVDGDAFPGGENGTDCDDEDADVIDPSPELCDGTDNDCNGTVDDQASDAQPYYLDADGDGYGDSSEVSMLCEATEGFSSVGTDCDDSSDDVSPGTSERCDGIDNDCNSVVDDGIGISGAVNYWSADGTAEDGVGTEDGTVSGATYTTGKFGQAWKFDGVDDIITMSSNTANFGTDDFTLSFWMSSSSPNFESIGGKRVACNGSPMIEVRVDTKIVVEFNENGEETRLEMSAYRTVGSAWQHVAITRQGTLGRVYIDGVAITAAEASAVANVTSSSPWSWGKSTCTGIDGTAFYTGSLDEMAFFSRILSASEIQQLAQSTVGGSCLAQGTRSTGTTRR